MVQRMNVMAKSPTASLAADDLCSQVARGVLYGHDQTTALVDWQLPDEAPVAVQINSQPFTVMMATPADLRDFAIGLALAEGLIPDPKAIQGVLIMPLDRGVAVDIAVPQAAIAQDRLVRRAIEGRSGCGLCGVEDIDAALRPLSPLSRDWTPDPAVIVSAAKQLPSHQPMNRVNRSVHAAAWVGRDGKIEIVREDVGRHNALDKLIGALVQLGVDRSQGFVVMTSRCSFELVQKCATVGIGALVTVSAPTALALDIAQSANLFLASLHRDGVVVFNP